MGTCQSKAAAVCEAKTLGRRKSSVDTIGAIRRAAAEEFARLGFDSATVEGIARRANVSKQLLYYYFGNKADLYSLILEDAARQSPEFAHDIDLNRLDAASALKTFIDIIFTDYERRPCIVRMTMDEAQHNFVHVGRRSPLAERLRASIRMLDRILRRGAETGEFRPDQDADALFWTIFGLVTNWFSHSPMMALVSSEKLEGGHGLEYWRECSAQFVLNAVGHSAPRGDGRRATA